MLQNVRPVTTASVVSSAAAVPMTPAVITFPGLAVVLPAGWDATAPNVRYLCTQLIFQLIILLIKSLVAKSTGATKRRCCESQRAMQILTGSFELLTAKSFQQQCQLNVRRRSSRLSKGQYTSAGLSRIWQSHDIAVATEVRLLQALVRLVAVYGCESWTLRAGDEKRLQAFEMRGLRQILRVSWTAKHTNDCRVLNKAEVSRNLLESVKARKLTYILWTCCEK